MLPCAGILLAFKFVSTVIEANGNSLQPPVWFCTSLTSHAVLLLYMQFRTLSMQRRYDSSRIKYNSPPWNTSSIVAPTDFICYDRYDVAQCSKTLQRACCSVHLVQHCVANVPLQTGVDQQRVHQGDAGQDFLL